MFAHNFHATTVADIAAGRPGVRADLLVLTQGRRLHALMVGEGEGAAAAHVAAAELARVGGFTEAPLRALLQAAASCATFEFFFETDKATVSHCSVTLTLGGRFEEHSRRNS